MDARQKATIEAGKLAQIESDFVEAKESGKDTPAIRAKLEKARREYREQWRIPTGASVQPATVAAGVAIETPGGVAIETPGG